MGFKYKVGDRVRVITPSFARVFAGCNEWTIDSLHTEIPPKRDWYLCYRDSDRNMVPYQFFEEDIVKIS